MARGIAPWTASLVLFITYLVYLVHIACPDGSFYESKSLNFVDHFACHQLKSAATFVEHNHVLQDLDSKLHVSDLYNKYVFPNVEHAVQFVKKADSSYGISAKVSEYAYVAHQRFEHKIWPKAHGFLTHHSAQIQRHFGEHQENIRHKWALFRVASTAYASELYGAHLAPHLHSVWYKMSTSPVGRQVHHYYQVLGLDRIFEGIGRLFVSLTDRSSSLQLKTQFLKSELKGLVKPLDKLKAKFIKGDKSVAEVVKEIIEEVEESLKPQDTVLEEAEAFQTADEVGDSEYDSDSDSEPSTVLITSTITVQSEELGVSENSHQHRLNEELQYWQSKVDKTLRLAYNSLDSDFSPLLEGILEDIKVPISESLKQVQQTNYEHYKKLNIMISDIEKDVSHIQETGEFPAEYSVSRQDMRDGISAATELSVQVLEGVQEKLAGAQKEIIIKYFSAIQNTIDILESFADVTVLEFSNRLTALLSFMEIEESYDEELGWKAWKLFHKTKEQIFQIRDKIFDEANEYKAKYFHADNKVIPEALRPWDTYFREIHYHIGFLTHDNEEYLRLVRARANVAFQARESLEAKKAAEAEEGAKVAEAKAEVPDEPVAEGAESEPVEPAEAEPGPAPVNNAAKEPESKPTVVVNEFDDDEKIVVVDTSQNIIDLEAPPKPVLDDLSDDTAVESDSE